MDTAGGTLSKVPSQTGAAGADTDARETDDAHVDAALAAGEYRIAVTAESRPDGRFVGVLKVVRKRGARLLYPFAGAPEIGRYDTIEAARAAAQEQGRRIVALDLRNPEP